MEERQSLKTKIALDLLVTPWTVAPCWLGITMLAIYALIGSKTIGFIGFCACLVSIGALTWNFVFNFDKIRKKAAKDWAESIKKEKDKRLNSLDRKLVKNKDPRDQLALRDLRVMYDEFQRDIENGKISRNVTSEMLSQVDQIFDSCIHELEQSYNIWRTIRLKKISDSLKNQLKQQREEIIEAVQDSVSNMALVTNEIRSVRYQSSADELRNLGQKLASHLETAKRVEERISKFGSDEGLDRFDKYATAARE